MKRKRDWKLEEYAPGSEPDRQAETTAGKPSPKTALPAVGDLADLDDLRAEVDNLRALLTYEVERADANYASCERVKRKFEDATADLKEARERVAALEAAMNPQDVADVDATLSAPDSTPPRRDGVAGDVQPLRPRE